MAFVYQLQSRLVEEGEPDFHRDGGNAIEIKVMTAAEADSDETLKNKGCPSAERIQDSRFTKAEAHMNFLCGAFALPEKRGRGRVHFGYVVLKNQMIFIDSSGFVLSRLQAMKDTVGHPKNSPGFFLADFLDAIVADDLIFLTEIENGIAHLEDQALAGTTDQFNHKLMECRRQIMVFSHYYLQLLDVSNVLQQDELSLFGPGEKQAFRLFGERIARLHNQTQMLREYCMQVREVYQSQVEIRQNKIMKILTIVTTIFLPLTLIVGWYGMNFKFMPELGWKYGYPAVALLCALIVGVCIGICKKKHFF